jgi:hypothetical protein
VATVPLRACSPGGPRRNRVKCPDTNTTRTRSNRRGTDSTVVCSQHSQRICARGSGGEAEEPTLRKCHHNPHTRRQRYTVLQGQQDVPTLLPRRLFGCTAQCLGLRELQHGIEGLDRAHWIAQNNTSPKNKANLAWLDGEGGRPRTLPDMHLRR